MLIPRKIPPLLQEGRKFRKLQKENDINLVLSAFRSFRSVEPVGYLSTPITTGVLFYEVLERYQVKTLEELTAIGSHILFEEIIRPNTGSGIILGDHLAKIWRLPIIVPAVFEAKSQRWTQDDYMYIWYQVIKEMVGHTIMRDGWQYGNGCIEEFVHSIETQFRLLLTSQVADDFPQYVPVDLFPDRFADQKIEFPEETMKITDQRGFGIAIDQGIVQITEAIIDLSRRGFRVKQLLSSLMQLVGLARSVDWYVKSGQYKTYGLNPPYAINLLQINDCWQKAIDISHEDQKEIRSLCFF